MTHTNENLLTAGQLFEAILCEQDADDLSRTAIRDHFLNGNTDEVARCADMLDAAKPSGKPAEMDQATHDSLIKMRNAIKKLRQRVARAYSDIDDSRVAKLVKEKETMTHRVTLEAKPESQDDKLAKLVKLARECAADKPEDTRIALALVLDEIAG